MIIRPYSGQLPKAAFYPSLSRTSVGELEAKGNGLCMRMGGNAALPRDELQPATDPSPTQGGSRAAMIAKD